MARITPGFGAEPGEVPQNARIAGYTDIPDEPHKQIGFELSPRDEIWSFTPEYYPDAFRQTKGRELDRNPRQCFGETISVKEVKNREFHIGGVLLAGEVKIFQSLLDYSAEIDLLSPLTPSGGAECYIDKGELGDIEGYDPMFRQWRFEYTLDLVSSGRDEYGTGNNAIITEILSEAGKDE